MAEKKTSLLEIGKLFLKLGSIAFGGPAAHIAMMETEVVKKRKWVSQQHFLDLIGATNLIPGPNSTEMTMHMGHERGGWKGLFVAGFCFIFPAVLITLFLAYLYGKYGQIPQVESFIYGIKPAVIAIIIGTLYRLGKKALKSVELAILGLLTITICLLGVNEIFALFGCGLAGVLLYLVKNPKGKVYSILPLFLLNFSLPIAKLSVLGVFWTFLKVGSLLYGGGYVLFAFLDAELVNEGILTRSELIDAIAIGQFTPGPVLSTATFIGYQLNGFSGAIAATVGIFLPSFIFVLILNPIIPKLRKSALISAFLDAVNIAAVAVIAVICIEMGKETLTDWKTILIAAVGIISVFVFKKLNPAFIVIGGSLMGYALTVLV